MVELRAGGNTALGRGAVRLRVAGPFDLSALVTGPGGKVGSDGDFVFYHQPEAPGLRLGPAGTLTLDPARLRPGAERVTLVVSAEEPGRPLAGLPLPVLTVDRGGGGGDRGGGAAPLARFAPPAPGRETVLLLAEVYRRGTEWKLRALGQGYADGLAGLVRDFGVEVAHEEPAPAAPPGGVSTGLPAAGATTGRGGAVPEEVRAARARAGVVPVRADARLTAAAGAHAAALAEHGELSVRGPDGTSLYERVTAEGYAYVTVGEHLVSGPRTDGEFVAYCLGEAGSRRTLLDPALSDCGLGRARDRSGRWFWTAVWAAPYTPAGLERMLDAVVAGTNAERATAGLTPLTVDARLTRAAGRHSADMVARRFYSHTDPDGGAPWDRAAASGSGHRAIGENIACGQRSAPEVVRGWMESPGHRANILGAGFSHIGVGWAGGGSAGTYWTQLFGG